MFTKQRKRPAIEKSFLILWILALLLVLFPSRTAVQAQQGVDGPNLLTVAGPKVYLPMVRNGGSTGDLPLMSGVYPTGGSPPVNSMDPTQYIIDNELKPMENWLTGVTGGRSTTIYGTYITLELTDAIVKGYVENPLTVMWNAGYTPFINLPAVGSDTARDVATSSSYDRMIRTWAKSFKIYANGGARFAYIAPLQEMNGEWVPYGGDPGNYILAVRRFQTIFAEVGVPRQSVKWVFAPNGWSHPDMPSFEAYYPGDSYIDVVAISAYNFGYCSGGVWEEPQIVFNNPDIENGHYLDRLRAMAPSKPIFIAQTATSSFKTPGSPNASEKERWLRDAYAYLSHQSNVKAILYFNKHKECDWEIFTNNVKNPGYKTGVNSNGNKYVSPSVLMKTDHSIR